MSRTNARKGGSLDLYRDKVNLTDLNAEWLEDQDLAEDISQDCLKLFETTESSFAEVRGQRWYKRLWSTLTGGNTRKLAGGAENLAQAQQLLLKVLQVHAQSNARSNALMVMVARGLRHLEGQQNQVVRSILQMADRIELLEKEVDLHRRQLEGDPGNVHTWNQEHRLLLFKLLVLSADADGNIAPQEDELLDHQLQVLGLQNEYHDEACLFRREPEPIDDDIERIDSYRMRVTMYRFALGVMYADGRLDPNEKAFIERLSKALHIRSGDKKKITEAFGQLRGDTSHTKILSLMSGGGKRKISAPDKEEFKQVTAQKEQMREEERKQTEALQEIQEEIHRTGAIWAEHVADVLAAILVTPLGARFEVYGNLEDVEIEDAQGCFEVEALLDEINENAEKVQNAVKEVLEDLGDPNPLPAHLFKAFDESWSGIHDAFSGVDDSLADLVSAGADVLDAKPSGVGNFLKGGLLGYASTALLGPVGLAAGAATYYFASDGQKKRYERACRRWDGSVTRLGNAAERWLETTIQSLERFFLDVVAVVVEVNELETNPELAARPLLAMLEYLEEDDDVDESEDYSAGMEDNGCPRCGRRYPERIRYCDICEVAL